MQSVPERGIKQGHIERSRRGAPRTFWANLSLSRKGMIVVALPLMVLVGSTLIFYILELERGRLNDQRNELADTNHVVKSIESEMSIAGIELSNFLSTGSESERLEYEQSLEAVEDLLDVTRSSIEHFVSPIEINQLLNHAQELLELYPRNAALRGADESLTQSIESKTDAIRALAKGVEAQHNVALEQIADRREVLHSRILLVEGAALFFGLVGGGLAMLLFTAGIAGRVRKITLNAQRLADREPLKPMPHGSDEIGQLAERLQDADDLIRAREDELQRAEKFAASLITSAPGAFVQTELPSGVTTYASPALERITGHAPTEVIGPGKSLFNKLHPEDLDGVIEKEQAAWEKRASHNEFEVRLRTPGGEYRWIFAAVVYDYDESGVPSQRTSYLLDASDRRETMNDLRRSADDLREAKEVAEQANRAKSEFLSRMSHELRTPLNSILGFSQLLSLDDLSETQHESVQDILKAGRHLLGLIDEILDISRIETGNLPLSLEPVSLDDVVAEVLDLCKPLAARKDVELIFDRPAELEGSHIRADARRVKQVLLNLVSNAVKYNREGGTATVASLRPTADVVRITVTDTGIGIPSDRLENLFEPFNRLGAEAAGIEGTGLGLVISKRLVEAMGGTIGLSSKPGVGTEIWVDLAFAEWEPAVGEEIAEHDQAAIEPDLASRGGIKVLYIEDNFANLKLMERILERRPEMELLSALQGSLGLELARQHELDLIFLDLDLPDVGGEVILQRLKEQDETRSIPVVVLSADATPGQIERLMQQGATDYITKPLDVSRVLGILDGVARGEFP